ncbi:hypothetical protein C439_10998 [Haloferax mediterranei ATCC 33500]|uniref:Uncharacterized protein n=1 Tax=Haloferax mediterranei (strain ATCC 33500 / DSM 1411 / JCM 8866 / NBRC 14739 / NCIMB 2177 / R-4) TaxID=523841 RepID=M0IUW6_HALMT|nr:hypothetical protein C439_10998 [Haloferax mediterranei ATCC 33500]
MTECYIVSRVTGMCSRPAPSGRLGEELLTVRTLATTDDPRGDTVRKMSGVAVVVQCKLFDRLIAEL